ncbi:MAG: hypothetical protein R3F24_09025 [Gammaproteobacteria bacterium]
MAIKVLFVGNYAIPLHNIRPEAEMIIGLKQRGLDVEVVTQADCYYAKRMSAFGIRIHDYTPPAKFSPEAVWRLRHILRSGHHDVIQPVQQQGHRRGRQHAGYRPARQGCDVQGADRQYFPL